MALEYDERIRSCARLGLRLAQLERHRGVIAEAGELERETQLFAAIDLALWILGELEADVATHAATT